MRKSGSRIRCDVDRIHSDSFVEFCRNGNPNVFVRNRKMPLDDLTYSMINRKGLTLKLELRGYMSISHPGTQISKPGYLKQRMKLNPDAFVDLYKFHNRNYYSDPDTELYTVNGFLVLATNLPRDQFPADCFGEIYHLRWRIETAYQTLKDRLQMENFTGTKPILLEQDPFLMFTSCSASLTCFSLLKNR